MTSLASAVTKINVNINILQKSVQNKKCEKRHPKRCRYEEKCRRQSTCRYRHQNYDMENLIKEQKLLIDQLKSQLEIVNTENKMLKKTHQKVSNTTQTAPQTVHNICEASQTVKDMNYMQEVDIQLEENKKTY